MIGRPSGRLPSLTRLQAGSTESRGGLFGGAQHTIPRHSRRPSMHTKTKRNQDWVLLPVSTPNNVRSFMCFQASKSNLYQRHSSIFLGSYAHPAALRTTNTRIDTPYDLSSWATPRSETIPGVWKLKKFPCSPLKGTAPPCPYDLGSPAGCTPPSSHMSVKTAKCICDTMCGMD